METQAPLTLRECVIGDRAFYRRVLVVVLPIILQNTLSNVVSLLDNVMVGQIGTIPMSAVAIINQLLFVYMLCIWGSTAGAGIFGAQFYGKGDMEGVRYTFRFKLLVALGLTLAGIAVLVVGGSALIGSFISADTLPADAAATLAHGEDYLRVMLLGLIPFAITQCYAGTLRESGQTTLPMKASMIAMCVNFVFNCLLIFGLLGFPKLGVVGAGLATALSRLVELCIVVTGAHRSTDRYPFMKGVYRNFRIPKALALQMASKSLPLLANEMLWSMGQAMLLQCYSVRGIAVIAALNIANTISQIFNEVFLSLGNATAIVVGQELGASHPRNARRTAWRMQALSLLSCVTMGALLAVFAPLIPHIYNTEDSIRALATQFIWVICLCMPLFGFANCAYFTLRSGGKAFITFLFDSCYSWLISVPAAVLLSRFTALPVVTVYLIVNALDIIKCSIGFAMVKSGTWVRNIVQ